jgi:hypothetical protein
MQILTARHMRPGSSRKPGLESYILKTDSDGKSTYSQAKRDDWDAASIQRQASFR